MPINVNYARHALSPLLPSQTLRMIARECKKKERARRERGKKSGRREKKKARLEKYPAIYAFNYAAAILRRINIACASQPLIKSSLDAVPRSFMQAACLEEKMAEDGAERVVDKRGGPGVEGKGKKLPLQSFIKCMHMRGHRVHDENCETTARRFWGEGRRGA